MEDVVFIPAAQKNKAGKSKRQSRKVEVQGAKKHEKKAASRNNVQLQPSGIVLLTAVDVRRFVKKLIETRFRELEVLSFGEITDSVSVNVIRTV